MQPITLNTLMKWLDSAGHPDVRLLGKPAPDMLIDEMIIDSRKTGSTSLFCAFAGERTDGHDYIGKAFEAGTPLVLASDEAKVQKIEIPEGRAIILVENVTAAIGRIARSLRESFPGPVIGITGSVGKTSTKDLTAAVLSGHFHPLKTQGNLNNEIGLPMTLTRLCKESFDAAVVEMGLDRAGDIDYLASLAEPEIGIVTNIGTSHIENFGSQEGILHAKLELVPYLRGLKKLFLNGDDPLLYSMRDQLPVKPEYFGKDARNDCRLLETGRTEEGRLYVRASYRGAVYEVSIDTLGLHMAMNVLPGIMTGVTLGMTAEEIREGLRAYEATPHRLQPVLTSRFLIIDDTYNASPTSMMSALDTLMELPSRGRRVAVLGDIKEMGTFSREGHRQVGAHAAGLKPDLLLTCGEEGRHIYEAALEQGMPGDQCLYFPDLSALKKGILPLLQAGDTVLLKASHSMEFTSLVPLLTEE